MTPSDEVVPDPISTSTDTTTVDEHPNAVAIRTLDRRLHDGDLTGVLDLLTDDVVFHVEGASIVAGDHVGRDAVVELGLMVFEETDGTHRTELLGVLANDSYVTTLQRWTARRREVGITMNNVLVYRLVDGQVAERWEYVENRQAHDRFWSR